MSRVRAVGSPKGHRLSGEGAVVEAGNRFFEHLGIRGFSPSTVRAYAFDLANFAMFLDDRLGLADVVPTDLFAYLDWQTRRPRRGKVVAIGRATPAPATLNRRISAVRGLFEHLVTTGARPTTPFRPLGGRAVSVAATDTCWARRLPDEVGRPAGRQPERLPECV